MCIFLIGLFAFSCTSPPDYGPKQTYSKIEFAKAVDQLQAPVIFAFNGIALPAPDNPANVMLVQEIPASLTWIEKCVGLIYDLLALKIKTSRISSKAIDNYQLLTFYVADKSKDGRTLSIRDKL